MSCEYEKFKKELKKAGVPEFMDVYELADFFNLKSRRIQELARDSIIPKSSRGKYEFIPCISSYLDYMREKVIERIEKRF